jgi:hypothetical protein
MWQTWSIVTSPVNMHEVWEVQRCQKEAEIKIDQRCMGTWSQWPTSRADGFDCGQSAQGAATAAWLGAGSRAGRGTRLPVSWRGEGFWSCRSKLAIEPSVIIQAGSITQWQYCRFVCCHSWRGWVSKQIYIESPVEYFTSGQSTLGPWSASKLLGK